MHAIIFLKINFDLADNIITVKTNIALVFKGAPWKRRGSALFIWLIVYYAFVLSVLSKRLTVCGSLPDTDLSIFVYRFDDTPALP